MGGGKWLRNEVIPTHLDEVSLDPSIILHGIIDRCLRSILLDIGMGHIRKLGGGVVAPDNHVFHSVCSHAHASSNLSVDM